MRTTDKNKPYKRTIAISIAYWIETNHPDFYRLFKTKMEASFEFDHKWLIYFQKYGLTLKLIQSVITEHNPGKNVTSNLLDDKLKKLIKKTDKKIRKNG